MTTLCFDGTTLAADRKMADHYNVQKIFPVPGGWVSGCGDYDFMVEIVEWMRAGRNRDAMPTLPDKDEDGEAAAEMIFVPKRGRVRWLTWPFLREIHLTETRIAFGSGRDFALGALAMGATARQAIAIAARFDADTGQGIDTVKVR